MSKGPVRRSQLIAPFGTGAMTVVRDGTSMVAAGLDHWFVHDDGSKEDVDIDEYIFHEWRLEKLLRVNHFRFPPDFRRPWVGEKVPNCFLTVPFLRFPQWHYCTSCGWMEFLPLSARGLKKCPDCASKEKTKYLVQVPFIAVCEHGHMQDFPWREWVHSSVNPSCKKPMRLKATGGATLSSQIVECECGKKRSLASITISSGNSSILSKELEKGKEFLCQGKTPWHGSETGQTCDRPLRGSLRSASNVYYPQVKSSIYLPRGNNPISKEIVALLEQPPLSTILNIFSVSNVKIKGEQLKQAHYQLLNKYSDEELNAALKYVLDNEELENDGDQDFIEGDDLETSFRRPEFYILRSVRDDNELKIRKADINEYDDDMAKYFSKIMLVDKLKETRVLAGFNRVFADNQQITLDEQKALLWKSIPENNQWLPAYVVYGEGIYLEFKEEIIRKWLSENNEVISKRVGPLIERYNYVKEKRKLKERPLGPRFILVHTFAHLLMNRLIFECGYSSASLKERLYISDNPKAPMAGVLVYTAAGDAEGTMGGLVRMGKTGYFEPMVRRALEGARWCSADPVCMETGSRGGQGPDSCNLAACHNCALVPETACEEFNRFLDRGLVIGDFGTPGLGFFEEDMINNY